MWFCSFFCEAAVRLKRIGGPLFMRLIQKTGGKQKPAFRFSFENVRRNECGTDVIVRIQGLNKTFRGRAGTVVALNGIDLDIYRGEIFGIIGLSGAGKSTLVRCINFLEKPTASTATSVPVMVTPETANLSTLSRDAPAMTGMAR